MPVTGAKQSALTFMMAVLCATGAMFPATAQYHTADTTRDHTVDLTELLRIIQIYNVGGLHCETGTEDGFAPGSGPQACIAHDSDYAPQDWRIDLSELLRMIQFFNTRAYHTQCDSEDIFAPGPGVHHSCEGERESLTETILLPGNVPLEMVWIPAGSFQMGQYPREQDSYSEEAPQHPVTLSGFWLGQYELTKAQWTAVMGTAPWSNGAYVVDDPKSPAVYVSWNTAQTFFASLNVLTGRTFRLPSEAEWEYACRAGTATRFYWGDDPDYTEINDYAWWNGNTGFTLERYAHVAGLKLPNAWGLYDMSGNVWEWCQDWWRQNYAGAPSDGSAWESPPDPFMFRICRGGSWAFDDFATCRSARRRGLSPSSVTGSNGFRVAMSGGQGEGEPQPEGVVEGQPEGVTEAEAEGLSEGEVETETVMLPGDVPLEMVRIPAGSFMMGRYPHEYGSEDHEDPQHQVTVSPFWMGKYELTKAQWTAVMGAPAWTSGPFVLDDPDSPAVSISWTNAQTYISILNTYTGLGFRLPSEAEWEYACRAGTATCFYWEDDPSYTAGNAYAWWESNAWSTNERYAHAVGLKLPNAWGLYDMSGNVREWCQDWYHETYTDAPSDGSAWVWPTGQCRVIRGGCWANDGRYCRSAARLDCSSALSESTGDVLTGFRLAMPEAAFESEGQSEGVPEGPEEGIEEGQAEGSIETEGEGENGTDMIPLPGGVFLEMRWIPWGAFTMGSPEAEQDRVGNEGPEHLVMMSGFWLSRHELTKAQWTALMGTAPWSGLEYVLNHPDSAAVYISWNDAQAYVSALRTYSGLSFRLPSESEWEYACRAGTTTRFYWGDDPSYTVIGAYAWWQGNTTGPTDAFAHVTGLKLPNAFGLYDMSGNVWEWCEDDWHASYSGAPTNGSAWVDSPRGSFRVKRGGGIGDVSSCRSAHRGGVSPLDAVCKVGFRVAR